MNRKSLFFFLLILSFSFTCLFTVCHDRSINKPEQNQAQLDSLTLASLTKIDDYPLYVMTYYGDYGFAEYLKTGYWPGRFSNNSVHITDEYWACTCFAALAKVGDKLFGRNFDYPRNPALLLFTNPPDAYASVSMVDLGYFGYSPSQLPDSPTKRQNLLRTPILPFDGMNEHGVAVGMMAISHGEPPFDRSKVTIGEIQVIRLVLDYAKNVDEAISLIKKYNVTFDGPPIHYLIADQSGKSVIIEFLNQQMIVMANNEPWQVSTNFIIHGSGAPDNVPCWRYKTVYQALKETYGFISQHKAMEILENASQSSTIWSAVYDLNNGEVHVTVGRKYDQVKKYQLNLNFKNQITRIKPVRLLAIGVNLSFF